MSIINNKEKTMLDAVKNALSNSNKIDIAVGYFYFSGFQALAKELENCHIRIIVGLQIDPDLISIINQLSKEGNVNLDKYQSRENTKSKITLKENYIKALVGFINDSDIFDEEKTNDLFDLFLRKLENGTLEIRKTSDDYHGKFYLVHNKPEFSQNGDFPGTLLMGSSNMTYNGLTGQGEIDDSTREKSKFEEYQKEFEYLWKDNNSFVISDKFTNKEFIKTIKPLIWKFSSPSPYSIYIRVLHEIFSKEKLNSIKTPSKITSGFYSDLEYQVDAIKMVIEKLNNYNGAILADVVGLGKSVIASAVAANLNMKTMVIAPPHLIDQWEDYSEQFKIWGPKVYSSGNIKAIYEKYVENGNPTEPMLFILDEAHRYRNEDTADYQLLHQLCVAHPENKILLLTATPFNNDPKDVFALIKLFQVPGQATIRSIDNLSLRYRELIQSYKKLRRELRKDIDQDTLDRRSDEIAKEQRRLIEPVIIRRSRLDLDHITKYREDLIKQNISFPKIIGPKLLEYDLGDLYDLYSETLELITRADNEGFIGARYKPTSGKYMSEDNQEIFFTKYKSEFLDIEDLRIAQTNLSKFMKRLLVMRFESSKEAFKSTLHKMIKSNKLIENWWNEVGVVPIMKKGELPDPEIYDEEDGDVINDFESDLENVRSKKGYIEIDKSLLDPIFIEDVRHDTKLLQEIYDKWFINNENNNSDPKLDKVAEQIKSMHDENPDRKIVIFSMYKDTIDYLKSEMPKRGIERSIKYTASEGTENYKKIIKADFDASYPLAKQTNDFDVLVATDALSEGFNLHRAGVIINYDIPYNPTRVIQRVGRINRINKKVFDNIYIFNCFPTYTGEEEVRIKSISTLKIKLINAVVGSDTKTLTEEEVLESFINNKDFDDAQKNSEKLSGDARHRENYEQALKDRKFIDEVKKLPRRSRIKRDKPGEKDQVIVFGKKGENTVFTIAKPNDNTQVISQEVALPVFEAEIDEKSFEVDKDFNNMFIVAKEKLFAKNELPKIQGRRASAINILEALGNELPESKNYCEDVIKIIKELDDLPEGTLKNIAQIKLKDIKKAYYELTKIVPSDYIHNIFIKAQKTQDEQELLLFAEQLV